jgi:hypothetical protein
MSNLAKEGAYEVYRISQDKALTESEKLSKIEFIMALALLADPARQS